MNKTSPILKVIIKVEPKRNGGGIILFFPTEPANYGMINYYGSVYSPVAGELRNPGYGDADFNYYLECKPYKGDLADTLLKSVEAQPAYGEDYVVKRVYKASGEDRQLMWHEWRKAS